MNETNVTTALNAVIERSRMLTGDDRAFGVMLSRISRELRRTYGIEGAQTFLLNLIVTLPPLRSDGEVAVPSADYRMDENERAIWNMMHVIIDHARHLLADDRQMFTVILRCIANHLGDKARPVLIGYAETMAEAARYDR